MKYLEDILKKFSAREDNSLVIVACSSDEDYAKYFTVIPKVLQEKGLSTPVYIAGHPEKIKLNSEEGLFGYIYQGTHILKELQRCQKHLGINS